MQIIDNYFLLETTLGAFSSAMEIGVAANFGYSALFKLGTFSGKTIDKWARLEQERVIAAMAEAEHFNGTLFIANVNKLKYIYQALTYNTNCIAAVWAVMTGIIGFGLLCFVMPFYSNVLLTGKSTLIIGLALFGAVPLGMLVVIILHICAKVHMYTLQRRHNVVIQYTKPLSQIEAARKKLKLPRAPKGNGDKR